MAKKTSETWKIPLYKIYTDDEDLIEISKVIRRGQHWALGPEIEEFEKRLSDYVNSDYCLTFNSGTSALHANLIANKITDGDEVIIPSFSFIATANSVLFVNAKPIFSDIEESTFGLDPKKIQKNITKKTRAIIPMDYGGLPCQIDKILETGKSNNLLVIEDAAEALGSSINNKKIGSFADSTIFSFCGNKVLTTGEGGAITTNSKEVFEKLKLIRSHGRQDIQNYFDNSEQPNYLTIGYNWRMSSLTASLGISQLKKLDKLIKLRKRNVMKIQNKLKKLDIIFPKPPKNFNHIYQMFTIRLRDKNTRDNLHKFLNKKRVFSKIYFSPIHLTKFYFENFPLSDNNLPMTDLISKQILTLPLYPNMDTEEIDYLTSCIFEFFEMKTQ